MSRGEPWQLERPDAGEQLLRWIEDTGDHPLSGAWCPGRHRRPWTVARVHRDAARMGELGHGRHRHASRWLVLDYWASRQAWAHTVVAATLAGRISAALRARVGGEPVRVITLPRVLEHEP